jgi:hypothetical protein
MPLPTQSVVRACILPASNCRLNYRRFHGSGRRWLFMAKVHIWLLRDRIRVGNVISALDFFNRR